jgi:hypothetical protein
VPPPTGQLTHGQVYEVLFDPYMVITLELQVGPHRQLGERGRSYAFTDHDPDPFGLVNFVHKFDEEFSTALKLAIVEIG